MSFPVAMILMEGKEIVKIIKREINVRRKSLCIGENNRDLFQSFAIMKKMSFQMLTDKDVMY